MQVFDPIEDTHALHQIEAALTRLMPTALSQGAQLDIEEMIDELAGCEAQPAAKRFFPRTTMSWMRNGGIAAAFCACSLLYSQANADICWDSVTPESDIEEMSLEGMREGDDGSALEALSLDKERTSIVLDKWSGMMIQVSEKSEETLLTPVSAF
jgi:hypothetical protein